MYRALDLSKYIVRKCIDDNCPISNLQLQKILYYIQRDSLQRSGSPIFGDKIEAWQFGPVVPNVYNRFCGSGSMPISFLLGDASIESRDKPVVDRIVESKRVLKPWDLVKDTHQKDGAWDTIYQNGRGNRHVIPTDLIKEKG